MSRTIDIDGIQFRLELTSGACPEQYDVFRDEDQVGYLRLRHGWFRADVPECGGLTVYEGEPMGDGAFMDHEREGFLTAAVTAIRDHYAKLWAAPSPEKHTGE